MEIKIDRKYKKDTYTISNVYLNGIKQPYNILEDRDRNLSSDMSLEEIKKIKVYGETAIPSGTYNVIMNYSPRLKKIMPLLLNVKGYEGVRIHSGNTNKDTLGCLVVGKNDVKGKVTNSRYWTNILIEEIKKALDNKESVKLIIE